MPAPSFGSAASNTTFGGTSTIVVNKPSGVAAGDLLVACQYAFSGFYNTGDSDDRLGPPLSNGWTTHAELVYSNTPIIGLYWKIADAADVAASNYTYRRDPSDSMVGIVRIPAGTFNTTTPINTYSFTRQTAAGANCVAASITPTVTDCLGVAFFLLGSTGGATPPAGWAEQHDANGASMGSVEIATQILTTSATGTAVAVAASSIAVDQGGFVLVAVAPSAATAPAAPTWNFQTAGDTRIFLEWYAPSDGGAAITDYVIQTSPNGTSSWTTVTTGTSTATTELLTAQTNATAQYFRVAAVNSVGTGAYSASSAAVTPRVAADFVMQESGNYDVQETDNYFPVEED